MVSESVASEPTSLLRSMYKHVTRLGNNLEATKNIRKITDRHILPISWLLGRAMAFAGDVHGVFMR